jgi:hypothetical protein
MNLELREYMRTDRSHLEFAHGVQEAKDMGKLNVLEMKSWLQHRPLHCVAMQTSEEILHCLSAVEPFDELQVAVGGNFIGD